MTVEGIIDKIKLEIYYGIRVIARVQHAKATREKALTYLKKIDKNLEVDIFTRKFQELIKRHFIEKKRESEQESLFTLNKITDFVDFDK